MKQLVMTGVVVGLLLGAPPTAAAQSFNIYIHPECEMDLQHFLVRNAALYVKAATEAREEDDRASAIGDANRVLMDALDRGEEANAAVWYFLGRSYALASDLAGADSAFSRAQGLAPDCADDIDTHRRFLWVPFYNEGVTALQNGDQATARQALTQANLVVTGEPFVPYYLASILISEGDTPGALELFKKTISIGMSEGDYEESYLTSYFNAARLHHMQRQWDSAATWYAGYRNLVPDDPQAIQGLASVLDAGGHRMEALAAFDTVVAHAGVMSYLDLFGTGVSLFQYERFESAIQAFEAGLTKNPHFRDGIYNLAQSYFAIANPKKDSVAEGEEPPEPSEEETATRNEAAAKMLEATKRLNEVDPQNESSMRLFAAAYQLTGEVDSTIALMEVVESLQYEVLIERFQRTANGWQMNGRISNLTEEEITVPGLVVEFVDVAGNVVESEIVEGSTIGGKGTSPFSMTPSGETVAAWRYRISN